MGGDRNSSPVHDSILDPAVEKHRTFAKMGGLLTFQDSKSLPFQLTCGSWWETKSTGMVLYWHGPRGSTTIALNGAAQELNATPLHFYFGLDRHVRAAISLTSTMMIPYWSSLRGNRTRKPNGAVQEQKMQRLFPSDGVRGCERHDNAIHPRKRSGYAEWEAARRLRTRTLFRFC